MALLGGPHQKILMRLKANGTTKIKMRKPKLLRNDQPNLTPVKEMRNLHIAGPGQVI